MMKTQRLRALSPDVSFEYKAQGQTLFDFHQNKSFVRVLVGPLGSGKTQACIFEFLSLIDNQAKSRDGVRRSRWMVVRNTYGDLFGTTIKDFRAIVDPMGVGTFSYGVGGEAPHWTVGYTKPDGTRVESEVIFKPFDHINDSSGARGYQLTGVYFNELKELAKPNVDLLIGRVKRFPSRADCPDARYCVIADSNAPDMDHWLGKAANGPISLHNWWIGIQPGGVKKVGGEWVENRMAENIHNLPKDYYRDQLATKREDWIRCNLANEFIYVGTGKPVHADFSQQTHVSKVSPTPGIPLHAGTDFGRTPASVIAQKQANGQWYVLSELVTPLEASDSALGHGKKLKKLLNSAYSAFRLEACTGDPAGSSMSQTRDETCIQMMDAAGIDTYPASTNDFDIRTTALDELLTQLIEGQPAILIDPSCKTLIKGLAGAYQFERVQVAGDERYKDKQSKDPTSHVCEALHYMLLGGGEGEAVFDQAWRQEFDSVDEWSTPAAWTE